jgi:hypothetical protein
MNTLLQQPGKEEQDESVLEETGRERERERERKRARKREREREKEGEKERERETGRERKGSNTGREIGNLLSKQTKLANVQIIIIRFGRAR